MLRRFKDDLRDIEPDCQEYFLQSDKESAMVTFGVVIFLLPFAAWVDHRYYGWSLAFVGSLVFEILYLLASLATLIAVQRSPKVRAYEGWVFGWSLFSAIAFSVLDFFQAERSTENITFILLFLTASYTLMNNRLVFRLVPVFLASAAAVSFFIFTGDNVQLEFKIFFSAVLLIVNIAGLVSTARHNRFKRSEFESYRREKEARQLFEALSTTDPLTGILNRRAFLDLLEQEIKRYARYGYTFTLIIIDLDYFKLVNDTYGHQAGDEALRRFTREVTGFKRQVDVFGRLGGEEFGLIFMETGGREALIAVERIKESVRVMAISSTKGVFEITFSAGLSEILPEDASLDDLYRRADMALYKAKQQGRNMCTLG
jgi:diguanylate cyclase (GGDEF)-like protein